MTSAYSDIIDMEYHGTTTHIPLPMDKRAAQFSPFAALSGYGDRIDEEMRYTDGQMELTEEKMEEINRGILHLTELLANNKPAEALITWFIPDATKDGGMYKTDKVRVKKIDRLHRAIVTRENKEILIDSIIEILLDNEADTYD